MPRCRFCDAEVPLGRKNCPACGAELPAEDLPPQVSLSPGDPNADVIAALERGGKIEAIRVYRERTRAGLAEAKQAVEALEAGRNLEQRTTANADQSYFELQLVELLRQGQKIQAIKAYRERTGLGLKDSKDAVENTARKHGIPPKGPGCAGWIVLVIALAVAAGVAPYKPLVNRQKPPCLGSR